MTGWITARLPWALPGLCLIIVATHLVLLWLVLQEPAIDIVAATGLANMLAIPSFVPLVVVGALVAARHPANRLGWLLCGIGLSWETFVLLNSYTAYAFGTQDGAAFGSQVALWAANWMFYPNLCLSVAFVPLLFPSGHLPAGRWRIVFWMALVGTLSTTAGLAFEPITFEIEELSGHPGVANPYGFSRWISDILLFTGFPLSVLAGIAAGASIVWRLRRARGAERQQLKWVAYVGALASAIFVVNTVLFIFELEIAARTGAFQVLSLAAFPIAAGIAIVRHQLFDIDRVINRTLVYGLLSLSLGAVYVLLILLPTLALGFDDSTPDLLVAGSTLAIASLFRPLRGRINHVVNRKFYRARYDAAQTIEHFSACLREAVDLTTLTRDLTDVVQETVQPTSAWVWLRPGSAILRQRN